MKKNRMMRLASIMLVLVLLTSSVVGGTFAKYVTSATDTDSARVARWGFEANTIVLDNLFVSTYDGSVDGQGDDVIAPGTKGSVEISFVPAKGTPEVAYSIKVEADSTVDTATNTICANDNIQWAVYKNGDTPAWGTFDAMMSKMETELSEARVEANNLPKLNDTYVVAWQWLINASDDVTDAQNIEDTKMGNAATLEEIDLTITITATQID